MYNDYEKSDSESVSLTSLEVHVCKNIKLVTAKIADAAFILSLRLDKNLNKFLSPVDSSLKKQEQWIEDYKKREAKKNEFYFIIKDTQENSLGTIRLYDFKDDTFCWGSWIINSPYIKTAAIESVLSLYDFSFNTLNFNKTCFDVKKDNISVIRFHHSLGAVKRSSDNLNMYLTLEKQVYNEIKKKWLTFFKESIDKRKNINEK